MNARVPESWEWVKTKVCTNPDCLRRRPWAEFSPKKYNEDGSVRSVSSRCIPCLRDQARREARWRNEDPERLRARKREWSRKRRSELKADRVAHDLLPVSPFRAWLDARVEAGEELGVIAERAGVPDRALRRFRSGEHDRVALDTVDRVLLHTNERVEDLYPELEAAA